MTTIILLVLGFGVFFAFSVFGFLSLHENEGRAARISLALAMVASVPFLGASALPTTVQTFLLTFLALTGLAGVILFLLPVGKAERGQDVPQTRFDERDIIFARAGLEQGTPNYEAYYKMRPENKVGDDRTRSLPGLLSLEANQAHPLIFSATEASFGVTEALRNVVDGPVAPGPADHEPALMSAFVKDLARYYGAHTVGIAELKPYHIYSHIGRGSGSYGAPVTLDHRYAVAFTVEMDRSMVGTGPAAPTVLESALQYVVAANIAVQLGNLIRAQGYPTRAHIDGNYRVVAPLVARDAGLGAIGRMGLLMTPTLGPRVRLGVVTTDMPLNPDSRADDTPVIDFCQICLKCAENCPVRAIPLGDREEIDGALRWRIEAEKCYRYWCVVGTDCGRCMDVCPYSYPDSPLHNAVRWAVRRSGFARRAALWLDGVFYGSNPPPKPVPSWVPPRHSGE